jgi:hypothetical protein
VTPALYYLVPSLKDSLQIEDPALPKDLFDPTLWQSSIIETLAEFIRLHGQKAMNQSERRAMARELFAAMLGAGKNHRQRLDQLNLNHAGLNSDHWLCIVGVNSDTRVRLRVIKSAPSPEFAFNPADIANQWDSADAAEKRLTGDGTVPFDGAIPKFLPYESLVCIRPQDFSFLEVADRLALSAAGFHGILPNMNMLHRLIVRFFTGAADTRNTTWGRPPPGVAPENWAPPLPLQQSRD